MSKVKRPCLFDNSKECPARNAGIPDWELSALARDACPICPKRIDMIPSRKMK